ncbi:Dihydroflavonol 4-reductase [Glycine soja]
MFHFLLSKCTSKVIAPSVSLWKGGDQLRFFQADLHEEGSFDEAVKGCVGVFHIAASMELNVSDKENNGARKKRTTYISMKFSRFKKLIYPGLSRFSKLTNIRLAEAFVQANIINPAIKGTINLLKSCLKSNSVKRVVFTSSISTVTAKDINGKSKHIVDESCQIHPDTCMEHTSKWMGLFLWWQVYALSKLLTEEAAFQFAKENGIDLVSVITSTVAGPFFTANVLTSVKVLLSPLTGETEYFKILSAVNARMGSIALVHIEDICSAHIFLTEHAKAEGRYKCSSQSCTLSNLATLLSKVY